ncbi:MAG: D-alanyl-D-alanine carboxypeptidase/D-alanyl-D-alanine-endopeptidase [Paludibacteraceae bacterium]|nr:D-alanyl-D-alanine carboxypeptidase/D-alanyl-D-alanine-endopeptidase [Paludibacteraceae bacterium]
MKKLLLILFSLTSIITNAQDLHPAVKTFVDAPGLHNAGVGILIKDVETEEIVAEYRRNTNLIPASITKLITTATALEVFSDTFKFETKVVMEGHLSKDSTLHGNIYVVGGGDPSIASKYNKLPNDFFSNAANAVRTAGIKKVDGAVIGDASLYAQCAQMPIWLVEDIGTYYAPTPSAICAYDNMIRIYVNNSTEDSIAKVVNTVPKTNLLDVKIINKNTPYRIMSTDYSWNKTIEGPFAVGKVQEIQSENPEPALFVADAIEQELKDSGVAFTKNASTTRIDQFMKSDSCKLLYTHYSAPLSEICRATNYNSINLYAENIFLHLGLRNSYTSSYPKSISSSFGWWNAHGVNAKGVYQVDGSGLSMKNAINPNFFVDMLIYMKKKSKFFPAFYASLPTCGVNGTVKSFLANTPLKGKAHFKSGSMERVQNYAGYVEHNGKTYAVCLMVNNFSCPRGDLRVKMGNMLKEIFK